MISTKQEKVVFRRSIPISQTIVKTTLIITHYSSTCFSGIKNGGRSEKRGWISKHSLAQFSIERNNNIHKSETVTHSR